MNETINKDLGLVTAYAYAVAGGYTGTEEEFKQLMADLVDEVERLEDLSVTVTTLPEGSPATASLNGSVLSLGIPKGDTGAKGDTGNGIASIAKTSTSGLVDTYTITFTNGTTTTFTVTNGAKGDKGDPGDVSQAQLDAAVSDLKSALFYKYSDASVWEQGGISSGTGANSDSTTRIRTATYIDESIDIIEPANGYKVIVAAYDDGGTYKGMWNGSVLTNSAATWFEESVNLKRLPTYKYRLVFADTSNSAIIPSDAVNCLFVKHTDSTLTKVGVSADAKAVGDALAELETTVQQGDATIEESVNDLRAINGEYQAQAITVVENKYIFQDGTSQYNGTAQNDTGSGYVKILVKEGERYKISGSSNRYRPLVVTFNKTTIGNSGYVGVDGASSSQTIYNDREFIVPSGIVMICVNTVSNTSYPISVKKFTPTKSIKYLAELDINSFAKNPLEYLGNEVSAFNKILCIGDSLTVGGKNTPPITPDDSHATREVTDEMYSYPRNLKKNYGCEYTVKATGGITSGEWLTTYGSDDLTGYDCAIIFLGSNDYMEVSRGMTVQEAIDAHSANIQSIINLVKSQNYGIPIFLCTAFPQWNDANSVTLGCNTNIRNICEATSGVFLIDFQQYSLLKADSPYRYTHPTAIGYMQMAREIAGAVCYYMKNDADGFKWIQYVGTRWAVEIN